MQKIKRVTLLPSDRHDILNQKKEHRLLLTALAQSSIKVKKNGGKILVYKQYIRQLLNQQIALVF